ncbi:MAG: Uma2 family endonuclease [Polyangiaceae bacterium]|nr:Uma2 family endonuclease [Polyangiaceae bacterium]
MARSAPRNPALLAPSSEGASLRAPGSGGLPAVDERLAPPETRLEYLDGIELFAAPADPPHALAHGDLAFVLRAHTAPGYRFAVDMLTRTDEASDFAPDASIFLDEPDPRTGGRRLEDLAFEVSHKQALAVPTKKARELARRGVRRVFCLLVGKKSVLEWSRETDAWRPLTRDSLIIDLSAKRRAELRRLGAAELEALVKALKQERRWPARKA